MNREFDREDLYNKDKENEIVQAVMSLQVGEQVFFHESDYGHGFIMHGVDGWECWSIPMYGGEECRECIVNSARGSVEMLASWT